MAIYNEENINDVEVITRTFAVDIPDINANLQDEDDNPYVTVEYFTSRKAAIKFAQKHYGADETGCICLVSEFGND